MPTQKELLEQILEELKKVNKEFYKLTYFLMTGIKITTEDIILETKSIKTDFT